MDNLAEAGSRYVGVNPPADQMFRDIMTGSQYNMETKRDAIRSFLQSDGDTSTPGVAPHVMQARLNLINSLQFAKDDPMARGMELHALQMEAQITGNKRDTRKMTDAASRVFRELEKRESRERRNGPPQPAAAPTIVPAP